mmetsp:Transcript_93470/g.261439  ORF Transcript_93470/g.261439 Transcript_93470/m.261439 type:complete len:377 (+) Transcript_93470:79-1209(+)
MFGLICGPHKNAQGSFIHCNEAWWSSQVVCAKVESVAEGGDGSELERFYKFIDEHGHERWIKGTRMLLVGPPDLGPLLSRTITGFTEVRQRYWTHQPHSWKTYHAFILLEIEDGLLYILCERKTDMLELVIGSEDIPYAFMKAFRAAGPGRNLSRCVDEPRQAVTSRVTVRQLFGWIDGPLEERWRPYDLLQANCQHFVDELQSFLLQPGSSRHVSTCALKVPPSALTDRTAVMAVMRQHPRALKYIPEVFRRDVEVVLAAVSTDGNALRYAPEELRANRSVALAALKNEGYALPYVHPVIRQERQLVLAAVQQNGYALCYCSSEHRSDRQVALQAVRSDGYALRYVGSKLRWDPELLVASGLQNPLALTRATLFF